jgi:alkanesulfonate monooxygenase SsuD/methylene tetrahydromethanopterin reductase-like flavin-dependent oxidoreductase (luciferase family)
VEFGVQFFPDVSPATKSAAVYFRESLALAERAEELGFTHVRTVEHYFDPYGGYSPNPIVFLSAVAARTRVVRLITGAVLPAFNHPLKLAGEVGMLDGISGGRAEIGFARAFLPHEFERFGVSLDESRARFDEGLDAVRRLLADEDVVFGGRFHSFPATTSLPRPVQRPTPPIWVAALATPESFERAGASGFGVMAIPMAGDRIRQLLDAYRDAWRDAGHPGQGQVMLAFHMFCHEDEAEAARIAREPLTRYLASLVRAASAWTTGSTSDDYPGYDKIIARLDTETFESQVESGAAWVGDPDTIAARIAAFDEEVGRFDSASLQINFNDLPYADARRSLELFGREVLPRFTPSPR